MAGNMESLLLGGDDDSSSGESDTNVDVGAAGSAVEAAVPVQAPPPAPAPAPVPAPVPRQQPSTTAPPTTSSSAPSTDYSMSRLKGLYSPAGKQSQTSSSQTSATSQPRQSIVPTSSSSSQSRQTSQPPQTSQTSNPASCARDDPYAPTPVSEIVERSQQYNVPKHHHHHQQQRPSAVPSSSAVQSSSSRSHGTSSSAATSSASADEVKRQKQRFVLFTRYLINYLKRHDPPLHERVGAVIKDCTARNKRAEPGYESVTASMKKHLSAVVSESIWKHVESIMRQNEAQHQQARQASQSSSRPSGTTSSSTPSSSESDRASMERRQKEDFQLFLRILVKHLEAKDPQLHARVNSIIRDCAERSKRKEPGFESVTTSVRSRLKEHVPKTYLEEARQLTVKYRTQQREKLLRQQAQKSGGISSSQQSSMMPSVPKSSPDPSKRRAGLQPALATSSNVGSSSSSSTKKQSAAAAVQQSGKGKSVGKNTGKRPKPTHTPARKNSLTLAQGEKAKAGAAAAAAATTEQAPVVREYSEFMEMVHHAAKFDWTTAGLSLGSEAISHLSQEQDNLLYKSGTVQETNPAGLFPVPGWGQRNVVSVRTAWSRLRLREQRLAKSKSGAAVTAADIPPLARWRNESTAEAQDPVLAVLSEGAQQYLQMVLEKAVHCARQRQNIDGIRLWHQQVTHADGEDPNPLTLRLGCDVARQFAQEQGNAALTVKRMEEALGRQTGIPSSQRQMTPEVLEEASSMRDLSLRPLMSENAPEAAEYTAKRNFEIYGGKNAREPPLGRVPKQARIEVVDFLVAQHLGTPHHRHKAAVISHCAAFF